MKARMTKEELMDWAGDHYRVEENSEGTPDEALMAGWVFAMDQQDAGANEDKFLDNAYSQFDNMGYNR